MVRTCTAVGLALALSAGWLVNPRAGTAVAGTQPPQMLAPIIEDLPGVSQAPRNSARADTLPPLLVDRFGVGLTCRSLAGSDPLPGASRSVPCFTACYSRIFFPGLGWTAAVGFGRRSSGAGDDPTFVRTGKDRVDLVPVELGLRFCRERPGLIDWGLDLAALAIWLRETAPPPYTIAPRLDSSNESTREYRNWVTGGRIAAGPRFRLPWHRLVVDLAGGVEVTSIAEGDGDWSGNATSASWRITLERER